MLCQNPVPVVDEPPPPVIDAVVTDVISPLPLTVMTGTTVLDPNEPTFELTVARVAAPEAAIVQSPEAETHAGAVHSAVRYEQVGWRTIREEFASSSKPRHHGREVHRARG